ncbi:hypothetical protein LTR53_003376 [Teratosphaeriaceae sp. CCFEE 6253]|nr:hypothetical protein LTR53_003376 [Teratosphaeriaceae sp. CCFEE 6253]
MTIKPARTTSHGHQKAPPRTHVCSRDDAPSANSDARHEREPETRDEPMPEPLHPLARATLPVPDLPKLARLLRTQKYQRRRLHAQEAELRSLQLATARTARLAKTARSIHRTLAECIQSEDKPNYDAMEDCAPREAGAVDGTGHEPFLDGLSDCHSGTIVNQLRKVRYSGDFIADRLAALSHPELLALLPEKSPRSTGSVFESSTGASWRASHHIGCTTDRQMDMLASSSFSSPLETLVHCVSGLSRDPDSETRRATDVWSTVCARLLSDQTPGRERLIPAVLDMWSVPATWPGKARLELWMRQILQRGAFLLDRPSKLSFQMRTRPRPEDEIRAEAFYAEAVAQLLDLLADQSGATVIPKPLMEMCSAIRTKLSRALGFQCGLPRFILTWFFTSFVTDAMTLPEART